MVSSIVALESPAGRESGASRSSVPRGGRGATDLRQKPRKAGFRKGFFASDGGKP
jgi:hypothetical protein